MKWFPNVGTKTNFCFPNLTLTKNYFLLSFDVTRQKIISYFLLTSEHMP